MRNLCLIGSLQEAKLTPFRISFALMRNFFFAKLAHTNPTDMTIQSDSNFFHNKFSSKKIEENILITSV